MTTKYANQTKDRANIRVVRVIRGLLFPTFFSSGTIEFSPEGLVVFEGVKKATAAASQLGGESELSTQELTPLGS
ncbi:MAG: hypothetical protein JXB10_10555 [Pirellulales bacterium]|nr:hypothetical protein [Pirellulales bacterium]